MARASMATGGHCFCTCRLLVMASHCRNSPFLVMSLIIQQSSGPGTYIRYGTLNACLETATSCSSRLITNAGGHGGLFFGGHAAAAAMFGAMRRRRNNSGDVRAAVEAV